MDEEPHSGLLVARRLPTAHLGRDRDAPQLPHAPASAATRHRRWVALRALLLLSFLAVACLAAPVWLGIVFGALMAFSAQPLYRRLCIASGERRKWAALLTTVATGALGVVGGATALYVSIRELVGAMSDVQETFDSGSLTAVIGDPALRFAKHLGMNEAEALRRVGDEVGRGVAYATEAAALVLQTTTTAIVGLGVGCFTMYYVLLEGPLIPGRLEKVLPLDPQHTRALLLELRDIGRSVLMGTMVTSVVQGVLGTLGFAICHVPHALAWGLMTAVSSFVPVLGTAIVWAPMSVYYLLQGEIAVAVALAAWGAFLVVGIGDYWLRPWLVGRQGKGRPVFMLISALGGIQVFGLAGIIVGPVLMSLFLAILHIYEREIDSIEGARLGEGPTS
jgi:predicted PurR-regulated permease PerM